MESLSIDKTAFGQDETFDRPPLVGRSILQKRIGMYIEPGRELETFPLPSGATTGIVSYFPEETFRTPFETKGTWSKKIEGLISEISKLKDNWDSFGTPAIDPVVVEEAKKFVQTLTPLNLPEPSVNPIIKIAGIYFKWVYGNFVLGIEIFKDQTIQMEYALWDKEKGTVEEGKIKSHDEAVDLVKKVADSPDTGRNSIEDILDRLGKQVPKEEWDALPQDLLENLDHYLYGSPKKDETGLR